jgi:predicted alpha/beta hydrolase
MEAIIYESNTGFTQKYAKLLSLEADMPAYTVKEAKKELKKGTEVVFLGWIMGGKISGFKKVKHRYKVKCVAGVGMDNPKNQTGEYLVKKNRIKNIPTYYLQGGFNMARLTGVYGFMMRTMLKSLRMSKNKTKDDIQFEKMISKGFDKVKKENLQLVMYEINKARQNKAD